jgi:hypothetical protein
MSGIGCRLNRTQECLLLGEERKSRLRRLTSESDPFETSQLPPSKSDAISWVYKTNLYLTPAIPAQPSDMSGKSTPNAAIPDKHQLNWLLVSERD